MNDQKTIIYPPVDEMFCASCQCPYDRCEPPCGPLRGCFDETCPCHAVYWMTVPELQKRRLWGDR